MRPRLVAVDRDGTLISWVHHLILAEDISLLAGSGESIGRLNRAGIPVALVTNQSVVGRGLISLETLASLHSHLDDLLRANGAYLDHYLVCPHAPEDGCLCRKPSPTLLLRLMADIGVQPHEVALIGDTLSDMRMAENAGVLGMRVLSGIPGEESGSHLEFPDLREAVDYLLREQSTVPLDEAHVD